MDSPSRTRFASPILSILFKLLYFCAISLIFSLACNLSVAYMFNKLHQAHSHNLRWWQDGPVSGKMQRRCDVRGSQGGLEQDSTYHFGLSYMTIHQNLSLFSASTISSAIALSTQPPPDSEFNYLRDLHLQRLLQIFIQSHTEDGKRC